MYRLHGAIHAYGASFSPLDLSPAAWYRYGVGVTEAGGFASLWADQSGNGRDLAQATGTNQPAYSAGVFTFDGADNYLKTAAFTLNQPISYFALIRQDGYTAGDAIVDGNTSATVLIQQQSSTPQVRIYAGAPTASSADLAIGTWGVVAAVFNGASSVLRVNNNADITGDTGAQNAGAITLGSTGGNSAHSAVSLKEFVAYNAALTDAQRDLVVSYLMALGGVA